MPDRPNIDRPRQTVSIDEIKARLVDRIEDVVDRWAPPAQGSYRHGPLYYTLNPGRPDRSVGSFLVHMAGPKAGRWVDYATDPRGGDLIDLIALSTGCSAREALAQARAYLGLDTQSPQDRQAEAQAAERRKRLRAQAEAEARAAQAKKEARGLALWLSGQEEIRSTPVQAYLEARGIALDRLDPVPRAIRFHPAARYYWTEGRVDPETGEVAVDARGRPIRDLRHRAMPAMLTAIARGNRIVDCHQTFLAARPDGSWDKADVTTPKKVFGNYTGGAARLCNGLGPKGGRPKLAEAPQGSTVWITEGIENALSLMVLRRMTGRPPVYVLAAGMVANFAKVDLPAAVSKVVLCADNDAGDAARSMLEAAIGAHRAQGREVSVWRSQVPGEDLNDCLRRALALEEGQGAA